MHAPITRRSALRATLGFAALALAGACTSPGSENAEGPEVEAPEADPLRRLAEAARVDAALAAAAAAAVADVGRRDVLRGVGEGRRRHADALESEISRAAGTVAGTPVAPTPRPSAAPDGPPSARPGTPTPGSLTSGPTPPAGVDVAAVVRALTASGADAADAALGAPAHRAGLLGSIAASCAATVSVLS